MAPAGLIANPGNDAVRLSWQLNTEEDFKECTIYRSTEEQVDFDTLEVYGTSTDSIFIDNAPLGKSTYYFVRATDIHENTGASSSVYLNITGVNESETLPTEFALKQNYPNPFNPSTTIQFSLPVASKVNLRIYNTLGKQVAELINREMSAGYQSIVFDASNLASGLYLYRIQSGDFTDVKKMMLIK